MLEQTHKTLDEIKKKTYFWLLIAQVIFVVSLPLWFYIAFVSLFLSDNPATQNEAYVIIYSIWSYPLFIIAASILIWVFYNRKKFKTALLFVFMPIIPIVVTILLFFYFFI